MWGWGGLDSLLNARLMPVFLITYLPALDTLNHTQLLLFQIGVNVNPWSDSKGFFLFSALIFPPLNSAGFPWRATPKQQKGHAGRKGGELFPRKGAVLSASAGLPVDWEETAGGAQGCDSPCSLGSATRLFLQLTPAAERTKHGLQTAPCLI